MLGLIPTSVFVDEKIAIKVGDLLVIQSDGVSEAMNKAQESFGEERLEHIILEHRDREPRVIIDTIVREVRKHVGGYVQSDDITIMILKRVA